MDLAQVIQIIHASGCARGMSYRWSRSFNPSAELVMEFDRLASIPYDFENL